MIGQFHENCEVTAARNLRFAVSKAPLPLFAIRAIALHDVSSCPSDHTGSSSTGSGSASSSDRGPP
ncbi:DUF6875 domain-containing protein [Streptomyces avermitilis]|uniref:DUF6875 domain-containing protein n=1 Tax=Streptomyces avermitilis TaxID=33903 RepID=UPI0033F4B855